MPQIYSLVVESWQQAEILAPTSSYQRGHCTRVAATLGRTLVDLRIAKMRKTTRKADGHFGNSAFSKRGTGVVLSA